MIKKFILTYIYSGPNAEKKEYLYRTIIFLFIEVLSRGMPLLVLPIITAKYSIDEVGEYSFLTLGALYALSFINISLHSYVNILIGRYYNEKKRLNDQIRMLFQLMIVISIFITLACIIMQNIFNIIKLKNAMWYIALICFTGAGNSFFSSVGTFYRGIGENKKYANLNFMNIAIFLMFIVYGVIIKKYGIWIILFSSASGYWIAGLVSVMVSLKLYKLSGQYMWLLRDSLAYSAPVSVNDVMNLTSANSSRLSIGTLVSNAALANYHVAATLAQVISVIGQAFNLAYVPFFMARHFGSKNVAKTNPLSFSVIFSIFSSSFLIFFSFWYLPIFFGTKYADVGLYMLFTMCAACMLPLYFVLTNILSTDVRLVMLKAIVNIIGAILGLGFTYYFTLKFGIWGAMASLPFTSVVLIVCFDLLSRYRTAYKVPTYYYLLYIVFTFTSMALIYKWLSLLSSQWIKFLCAATAFLIVQVFQAMLYKYLARLEIKEPLTVEN